MVYGISLIAAAVGACVGVGIVWAMNRARRTVVICEPDPSAEINEIAAVLRSRFGDAWVSESLREFTLAATVTRALFWNDESNQTLNNDLEAAVQRNVGYRSYIKLLENEARIALTQLYGSAVPDASEESPDDKLRDFLERTGGSP